MGSITVNGNHGDEGKLQLPSRIDFKLPDSKTQVWIENVDSGAKTGATYAIGSGDSSVAHWTTGGTSTRVSPAMINDDRAQLAPVHHLQILNNAGDSSSPFGPGCKDRELVVAWVAVYALWLHPQLREDDIIAVSSDNTRVCDYMRCTGLAVMSPFSPSAEADANKDIYWLQREAFWQGAGTPDSLHWLQSRPEVTSFPGFNGTLGVFANQMGFTKKGNVCTVHPLRPAKPAPGTVIYSRYIVELGQQLRILHIDAENPVHFETYKRWQNSDRVNASWQERGPDEHHRNYLAGQLADPHTMSCVFEWDGELAGYTELGYVKEDNAACFFGSNCNIVVGEHDQNSHIIQGEEHFRGGKRYQAVATSIKHCCFLRDPRTKQVVAEPRFDLAHVQIQNRFLPQEKKKRFHLPHKTAMLFALQRERFFQEAHFV